LVSRRARKKLPVADSVESSTRKPVRRLTAPNSRGPADPASSAGVGFVLVDASLHVLYANREAVRILAYPAVPTTGQALDPDVVKKVRVQLENRPPSPAQPALTELCSGRRRYLCRAFALGSESGSHFTTDSFQPGIAVLIERGHQAFVGLTQISDQYHLTTRERETMALLLLGLTSKQIAERMHVSPNTVKAFLRLIMLRMSVSTRSGIVGKILATAV
jgi:DNA-binding CsgD family transcriptional regulator